MSGQSLNPVGSLEWGRDVSEGPEPASASKGDPRFYLNGEPAGLGGRQEFLKARGQ